MNYGIPYMGSKSKILKKFCSIFPNADNFYDLFGGGFSVTHFMLENRFNDFKSFHFNEIRPGICELIQDAINGKYSYENFRPKFISREEFFKKKDTDPYVKMVWSFGNNGKNYLFSKEIEGYKKSLHNAIVFNEFDQTAINVFGLNKFRDGYSIKQKRLFLRNKIALDNPKKPRGELERLQQLQQLERLEQLQQLERLEQLQQLDRLNNGKLFFYNKDYRDVEIEENSVVYCDPPYIGTAEYDNKFNHKEFYDYCDSLNVPVFISEYNLNDKRFKCVHGMDKRSLFDSGKGRKVKKEKIFVNKLAYERLRYGQENGKTN